MRVSNCENIQMQSSWDKDVRRQQVSISSTCLRKAFTCSDPKSVKFSEVFCIFFALLVSARIEDASKMLMKSTCRSQFCQHFTTSFLVKKCFLRFSFCAYSLVLKFFVKRKSEKSCMQIIDEIDYRCQFCQHFMSSFFIQKCFSIMLCAYSLCL